MGAIRKALFLVDDAVFFCERWFLVAVHAAIAIFIVLGVFYRYALNDPMVWSEELLVGLFVWLVFVGASAATRTSSHIRLDLLSPLYAKPNMVWLLALTLIATGAVALLLTYTAFQYLALEMMTYSPTLDVSRGWFVAAMPVGMVCLVLHLIRLWVENGPANVFRSEAELAIDEVTK
jgi:TRAP-type C4-dicarboxylate transport system permease small subunit